MRNCFIAEIATKTQGNCKKLSCGIFTKSQAWVVFSGGFSDFWEHFCITKGQILQLCRISFILGLNSGLMRCLKAAQPYLGPRIYEGAVTEGDWGSRCGTTLFTPPAPPGHPPRKRVGQGCGANLNSSINRDLGK